MLQLTETGSKLGIHAQKTKFFDHLREAAEQGTPYPAVKMTQEQTALADVKRDSPDTMTIARVPHEHDGLQGIADEPRMDADRAREWAEVVIAHSFEYFERNPDLVQHIDVYELANEADPNTVDGWFNLGAIMRECVALGRERYPSIAWGIGSFNAGTPEYDEMQAFLESGVLDGAPDDVVLCVHEGILNPGDPIDMGQGELIPGAPSVPEHGGTHIGRIVYFAELAGDDMVPVIVSEAYLQGYDDMSEAASRARWADGFYSRLWYVLTYLPFTDAPTEGWKHQDYSGMYPILMPYLKEVADRQNATKPAPPPEPPPVDEFIWQQSQERDTINEDAALQNRIFTEGYVPYSTEFWRQRPETDEVYAIQTAFDWDTRTRAVSYAQVPNWGDVKLITGPEGEGGVPIVFAAWPTDYRAVTQRFGVGDYSRFGLPGHEGIDLRAPTSTPVYAVQDGIVAFAGAGDAYGNFVILDHGLGVTTAYAHCERLLVQEGQQVEAGERIAAADDTGNSDGSHLHLALKWAGHTYVDENGVSWPRNYFDPTPFLLPFDPTFVDAAPATIDLLPYLMGQHGHSHEMQYTWNGGGTHPLQLEHGPSNTFWLKKGHNGEYEELYYDSQFIYRALDTSEGPNKMYTQRTVVNGREFEGHPWLKRHMAIGEVFSRSPRVVHMWQDSCQVRARGDVGSTITLKAQLAQEAYPSGITVDDVVLLEWNGGEMYSFARGKSLTRFVFGGGQSYVSEWHDRQLTRNVPGCYAAPARYWR